MKKIITLIIMLAALTVQAQQAIVTSKVSRGVMDICHSASDSRVGAKAPARGTFLALLTFADSNQSPDILVAYGCRVIDRVGRIHIADIPIDRVADLSQDPRIERIEAERMPRPAMDRTPGIINATPVYVGQDLPQAFKGRGVAAGVFDSSFDFTHPAFVDADGNLRVKYYYDFHWPNADGTLGHALETTEEIAAYGHSQYTNLGTHGTHVMGIMAGSPVQGKYPGMAPESDIYVADFNSTRDEFENPDALTSATAVLGFKYIFDRAAADGKACVINFSSCESLTLTRQRQLEGEALLQLVGPGRIIVGGAGNEGNSMCRMEKREGDRQAGVGIVHGIGGGGTIDMDIVTPVNQRVQFDFLGYKFSGGGIQGTLAFDTDSVDALQGDTCWLTTTISQGDVKLAITRSDMHDERGTIYHIDGKMPDIFYLLLCGALCSVTGDGPAWAYSDLFLCPMVNVVGSSVYDDAQPGSTVSWPATLDGVISVGATGYKSTFTNINGETNADMVGYAPDQVGQITKFSSQGPTFDGRIKPTVVAPGLNINAAYNSFANFEESRKSLVDKVNVGGKDYYFMAQSGTSMATPVVAGAIALWLEADPTLTAERIEEVLAHTCTQPEASMTYPNNTYGYGQIDVYKGLLYILGAMDNIPNLSTHQPRQARIDVRDDRLHVDLAGDAAGEVTIYTPDGHRVLAATLDHDGTLDLSSLLPGQVYAVQLDTADPMTTGSTLIRP